MKTYRIAAIPGDGIGKEVVAAGVQVLDTLARREGTFELAFETFPWSSDYYKQHGRMMPADGLDTLRTFDAIYFGAVGAPDLPDDIRCGDCGSRSVRASTSTPMCGRRACCPGSSRH